MEGVYSTTPSNARRFADAHELRVVGHSLPALLEEVDAVYVASPHGTHAAIATEAMEAGKHVLCEKPLTLTRKEAEEMFTVAAENRVVLLEAIKTAFSPGFQRMVAVARSGSIGQVRSVDGTFTKLGETGREMQASGRRQHLRARQLPAARRGEVAGHRVSRPAHRVLVARRTPRSRRSPGSTSPIHMRSLPRGSASASRPRAI